MLFFVEAAHNYVIINCMFYNNEFFSLKVRLKLLKYT